MRRAAAGVAALALVSAVAACGGGAPDAGNVKTGVVVVSLRDGALVGARAVGADPVAVAVSPDGRTAYVSDNRAGVVRALALPSLRELWATTVGGRPGPILVTFDTVAVSLYEANEVVELATADGRLTARHRVGRGPGQLAAAGQGILVACADGRAWDLEGNSRPAGAGFGLAAGPGGTWTADYDAGALVRVEDGRRLQLPPRVHAFWLETAQDGGLLVAAEGDDEDRDPGAIIYIGADLVPAVVGTAHDPDMVAVSGTRAFVAAHGDHRVLVYAGGRRPLFGFGPAGLDVVALAPAPASGLLVLAVNAGE